MERTWIRENSFNMEKGVWKYACWAAARRMNQTRNRTEGNTLLMRTASDLYIKMEALGWPGSCNTVIKVTSAELASPTNQSSPAHVIRPYCELYCHAVCT